MRMGVDETVLLNKDESELLLNGKIGVGVDVYIVHTNNDTLILLKKGDLEKIRKAAPHRADIILAPAPHGTGIPSFDRVGYLDLRVSKIGSSIEANWN